MPDKPNLPHKLPEFKGYTVDERLQEFRKVTWENGEPSMETISFNSPKGRELLNEYEEAI